MKSTIAKPLAIIILSIFGFLLIITYYADKSQIHREGEEMAELVASKEYVLSTDQLSHEDDIVLIDLNNIPKTAATNQITYTHVPLSQILEEGNRAIWNSPKKKVLHATNSIQAHEAWMLLTQMGYENLYVIEADTMPSTY